jgi:EAL domain-containing protein (putative c-di-GMP-specific phosphodiesterase class I)
MSAIAKEDDNDLFDVSSVIKRVLIIDDDKDVARMVARTLTRGQQFEAVIAREPAIGLIKARQQRFDVIVSDIQMPGMTGLELIKGIRAFDLDTPIILLTGTPSVETAQDAVELGAFRYLTKPFNPEELTEIAKRAAFANRIAQLKRKALQLSGAEHLRPGDMAGMTDAFDSTLKSLWMAYQPIVRADSGQLFGYEALMRSGEPRLPYPGSVIRAAEHLDRIFDLGRLIRAKTVEPMSRTADEIRLFVNLHPRDLMDEQLITPGTPLAAMADRVVLEITEREDLGRVSKVEERIDQLRELGFRIAVDDLGAGYAGLSSFAALQPSIVKLDMSLIFDINTSQIKRRVVQSMVETCHDLDALVVAEGVETEAELRTCQEVGCDLLQGYFIARPDKAFPVINWV